jgi:hypothetical protein
MDTGWLRTSLLSLGLAAVAALPPACHRSQGNKDAPATDTPGGPSPSTILQSYQAHSPPPLASASDVPRFLDWAGASHSDERDDARKVLAEAAGRPDVINGFITEIERVQATDQPRALLGLALLGETRNPGAQDFFAEFARRPLPTGGPVIEGEIIEQTRAAQLQAKAVDGLAYANTEATNKVVTQIIAEHPSRIVRAEAINAYLWNHGDSDEARKFLAQFVRKDEQVLLDRVRRNTGENAEVFNRKLTVFLQKHPEVIPPQPEKLRTANRPAQPARAFDAAPPAF